MALQFADLWRWGGRVNGKTYAIVGTEWVGRHLPDISRQLGWVRVYAVFREFRMYELVFRVSMALGRAAAGGPLVDGGFPAELRAASLRRVEEHADIAAGVPELPRFRGQILGRCDLLFAEFRENADLAAERQHPLGGLALVVAGGLGEDLALR